VRRPAGDYVFENIISPPCRLLAKKKPVISQKLPSTVPTGTIAIYYGRLDKAAAFATRRSIVIKRSDERYFDTDQLGIAATERFDINCHDVGDASTIGPLVALKMG
jgi:HK97 family phage major capsid protein